jgi:hypothetical protein
LIEPSAGITIVVGKRDLSPRSGIDQFVLQGALSQDGPLEFQQLKSSPCRASFQLAFIQPKSPEFAQPLAKQPLGIQAH